MNPPKTPIKSKYYTETFWYVYLNKNMKMVSNSHTLSTITKGNSELVNCGMMAVKSSFSIRDNFVKPDILNNNKLTEIVLL